ncbi:MAG: ABC transporter substrate-binding protein [Candidatus Rokuibacteriota bacterium]
MFRLACVSVAALAWLVAGSGRVEAGPATDSLRATFTEANQIITDPATAARPLERLRAVRELFSKAFDFRSAAEHALGAQWRARTAIEQTEFTSLFAGFVQRGFVYWLASVAEVDGSGGGITVYYLGEAVDRDTAVVRMAIGRRGGRQVLLDHDMIYLSKRWMVRDVTIDGISLVTNYRAQFDRVIRGSSYRDLLARLRLKIGSELPRPASAGPETPGADLVKAPPLAQTPPLEPPFEPPVEMR